MGLLAEILDTVAYGLIIASLLFAAVGLIDIKPFNMPKWMQGKTQPKKQSDLPLKLYLQVAIFLAIAGFVLLIIGIWVH